MELQLNPEELKKLMESAFEAGLESLTYDEEHGYDTTFSFESWIKKSPEFIIANLLYNVANDCRFDTTSEYYCGFLNMDPTEDWTEEERKFFDLNNPFVLSKMNDFGLTCTFDVPDECIFYMESLL